MREDIKTYVVNMVKDNEKRCRMENILANHSYLDYEIYPATEGKKLTREEIAHLCDWEYFRKRYGYMATLPALGCSLSHRNIYEDISTRYDWVLILEDDANIREDIDKQLSDLIQNFNSDLPIVILLTPGFSYYQHNCAFKLDGYKVYSLKSGQMTSGYLINRAGARLLARLQKPVRFLADEWSDFVKAGLNLYGVVPHLISYPREHGEIGLSQIIASPEKKSAISEIIGKIRGRIEFYKGKRYSKRLW